MRTAVFVTLLLLSGCLVPPEPTPTPSTSPAATAIDFPARVQWRQVASAPTPRVEHCAAVVGSKFYVIGGYIIANPVSLPGSAGGQPTGPQTNRVEVYDAATNTWTEGPAFPHNIDHCVSTAIDQTIYVFYRTANGGSHKLAPGAAQWTKIADPPHPHNAGAGGSIGGRVYLTGGSNAALDVYDPIADKWETLADAMPTRRDHTAGAAVGTKFYVIGGDVGGHSRNTGANEEFDTVTKTWSNRSALPTVRGSVHGVEWFGRILVMGGQDGRTNVDAYDDVNVYNPLTDSWSELPPLPRGRHGFAAGVWQDKVFVFAGAPQQGVSGFDQVHVLEAAS